MHSLSVIRTCIVGWSLWMALAVTSLAQTSAPTAVDEKPAVATASAPVVFHTTSEPASGLATSGVPTTEPGTVTAALHEVTPVAAADAPKMVHLLDVFTPPLSNTAATWIAVTILLVLLLQDRPFLSARNLDALVLALTALAFPLRQMNVGIQGDPTGRTLQWWSYLLLSLSAAYWVIRGLWIARSRTMFVFEPNVSGMAKMILIVAVLCISMSQIMTAPLSAGSRDGLIGGSYLSTNFKLPYGQLVDQDDHGPLLYWLHAGVCRLMGPMYTPTGPVGDQPFVVTGEDLEAARITNAVLFVLTFLGLAYLGRRLHSPTVGLTLGVLFAVFPGVIDSLAHPSAMLAAMLITWSLALVDFPLLGGFLSVLLSAAAGLSWPWAWLLTPVLTLYLLRKKYLWPGAVLAWPAAIAGILWMMYQFVVPAPPRPTGALLGAGQSPSFTVSENGGRLKLATAAAVSPPSSPFTRWVWNALLSCDDLTLATCAADLPPLDLPEGTNASQIRIRDVATVDPHAAALLQRGYGNAALREPLPTRLCLTLRTVLEATWLSQPSSDNDPRGAWSYWLNNDESQQTLWINLRRAAKIVAVFVAFVAGLLIVGAPRVRSHQLLGGCAAVCAAALLAGQSGAIDRWVLVMPALLALVAAGRIEILPSESDGAPEPEVVPTRPPTPLSTGPRITIEK